MVSKEEAPSSCDVKLTAKTVLVGGKADDMIFFSQTGLRQKVLSSKER